MSDPSSSDSGYSNVDYDLKLRELTMQQLFDALQTNGRRVTNLSIKVRGGAFIFRSEGQYYTYYLEVETFIRNVLAHDNADRLRRGMQHRSPIFFGRSVIIEVTFVTGEGDNRVVSVRNIQYTPRGQFPVYRPVIQPAFV